MQRRNAEESGSCVEKRLEMKRVQITLVPLNAKGLDGEFPSLIGLNLINLANPYRKKNYLKRQHEWRLQYPFGPSSSCGWGSSAWDVILYDRPRDVNGSPSSNYLEVSIH